MNTTKTPSQKLTSPRRPLLTAGLVALVVVGVTGIGAGAYAITQAVTATPVAVATAEPTPTEDPNLAPTAAIAATVADLTVTVDSAASTDADGTIVEFLWSFGDGTTATEAATSHTYAAAGTFYVTLIVTDDAGATGSATSEVTVTAPPPPPPPPAPSAPAYGSYPSGYPMPMIPGTDAPDTSACASSAGYTDSAGVPRCL